MQWMYNVDVHGDFKPSLIPEHTANFAWRKDSKFCLEVKQIWAN